MKTLSNKLNFSDTPKDGAIQIKKWANVNFYETLCFYCSENNINVSDIDEDDFDGCSLIMADYGQADKSTDTYWFWID